MVLFSEHDANTCGPSGFHTTELAHLAPWPGVEDLESSLASRCHASNFRYEETGT